MAVGRDPAVTGGRDPAVSRGVITHPQLSAFVVCGRRCATLISQGDSFKKLDKELSGENWIVFFSVFADPGIMSLFVFLAVKRLSWCAQQITSVAVQEDCSLQDRGSDTGESIAERLEELLDVTDLLLVLDLTMCFWRLWSTVSIANGMHESSFHSCNTGVLTTGFRVSKATNNDEGDHIWESAARGFFHRPKPFGYVFFALETCPMTQRRVGGHVQECGQTPMDLDVSTTPEI